jgi:outer membrane protein TolC
MKTLIFAFLIFSASAFSQNVDYNKIILPSGVQTSDFAEKLVQIAWRNNPTNEVFRREVNVAGYETKKAAVQWLDVIHVQGNLNQFVLNPGSDVFSRAPFYPKYNVHGDLSLSWLFTIPYNTKQNKERTIIAQSQVNAQKLLVRNSVLKTYNEYLMREKVFKIQSQLALDNETSHKLVEQKFKNGQLTFETYSASLTAFSSTTLAQLEAERDYKNAKLDLEQLIGMRLEDVR